MNNSGSPYTSNQPATGRAATLRDSLFALFKRAKKQRPSIKQRRGAGFGKSMDKTFTTVKLRFIDSMKPYPMMAIEMWVIDEFYDAALISIPDRAGVKLETYGNFDVLLPVETMHDLLKLLDSSRIDMQYLEDIGRFTMKCASEGHRASLIVVNPAEMPLERGVGWWVRPGS